MQRFNRRRFLQGLAVSSATALVAACGRNRTPASPLPQPSSAFPTFTATPAPAQQAYLPWVQNGEDIVALPTNTPQPEATPTPLATPFPPGPPSKLGLFVARNHPQLFHLLQTKAVTVVKTLELDANFLADIKSNSPQTIVIGRIDLPQLELATLNPAPAAREFVERLMPYADDQRRRPYLDGWESYNEPIAGNEDEMRRLGDFEAERTRLLAERGLRSVIGNFGAGYPPLEYWQHFLHAVQAVKEYNGWLGLHEYSAPTIYYASTRDQQGRYPEISIQDSGWLTLRYRKVYNEILKPAGLAVPLIFTELGVDGFVQNGRPGPAEGRGWQDFQQYWADHGYGAWGPGAYIEQLVWFDKAMRQDDYVVGGCIYALAASSGWERYDILGPAAEVLQQYLSVHAPPE
jgi:hypothetical protein